MDAINEEIRQIKLTRSTQRSTGDLQEIKERGILRAVTRNNPGSNFMWKGRVLGYEFELLEAFAKDQELRRPRTPSMQLAHCHPSKRRRKILRQLFRVPRD